MCSLGSLKAFPHRTGFFESTPTTSPQSTCAHLLHGNLNFEIFDTEKQISSFQIPISWHCCNSFCFFFFECESHSIMVFLSYPRWLESCSLLSIMVCVIIWKLSCFLEMGETCPLILHVEFELRKNAFVCRRCCRLLIMLRVKGYLINLEIISTNWFDDVCFSHVSYQSKFLVSPPKYISFLFQLAEVNHLEQ